MRQLFISYARENKPDVEALVRDLDALGYQTWVDSSLQGGQTWWEEILRRIGNCDVFVAIVSGHTLNSAACKRELEWALAMNKPVLPLAVERLPDALPRTLSMRQIVNYSRSGREAAFALAGALGTLPAAPPPPEQLPEPPPAPLSYLSDLVEQVGQREPLTHEQQRQILVQLQPALRSADSEERRGGRYVLEMFSRRDDLYADVDRAVAQLGLTDRDAQSPVAAEVPDGSRDEHALTAPEVPAEGDGNLLADPQWVDALNAYWAKRWVDAVDRFEALQGRYPGEHRVETRLKEARRHRDIDAWSSKAQSAAADEDWDTVVTSLENLTGLDPNYPGVAARLEQARTAQRRNALVDEMTALHQAGRWEAVVAAAEELVRLDPDNPDPGGIVSDARAKIREAQLADRYGQALNHLDQLEWHEAVAVLTAIEQEQPGYRDAAALLKTAQRQHDLAVWSDQAAAAAGKDDWDTAVPALEKICAVDPTYQDAGARLGKARSAKRLRTLVDKVTALHQAGRWKEVVAAAEELAELDPNHPDPGGIVSEARAKIRETPPEPTRFRTKSPTTTKSADANKSATDKRGPKRANPWKGVAAGIGVFLAIVTIAITIFFLALPSKDPELPSKDPELVQPLNDWVNTSATVGTCFVLLPNQVVQVRKCSEPNVLQVAKLTYSNAECKSDNRNGYVRADNTGVYVCWYKTPS